MYTVNPRRLKKRNEHKQYWKGGYTVMKTEGTDIELVRILSHDLSQLLGYNEERIILIEEIISPPYNF